MNQTYLRGDLYYADLGKGVGSEQEGYRPVVIIQNNLGNKHSPTVIIAGIMRGSGFTQRKNACVTKLVRTGAAKVHIQRVNCGMDQVDTDGKCMIHTNKMLIAQVADVLCQPVFINSAYLLQKNDRGQFKAIFSIDKVVRWQLGLHTYSAGNGRLL